MTSLADIDLSHHDGAGLEAMLGEVADLYEVVYAEPPYNGGPLFSRGRFLERTNVQKAAPGFALVTSRAAGRLVGFSFGFTFAAGRWWGGTTSPEPAAEVLTSPKFAVIELVVAKTWRGQGLGRTLINALMSKRFEPYATLLSEPDAPARRIYDHWGWRHVADVQPAVDAPYMHALVLPLTPSGPSGKASSTTSTT
ncbi:GNAT family N-acetyltransferase [Solwaraspora sp. WMMD1047]|uniref:GNAT family N-acetyltransferase n=1 Tax=Solwaraspora sp. WMMD1047 TaxID=3016102 RepID=UPI002417B5E1|nr:GNAT family N-acetyltransferase [Solwaraspora sp. WMMD1047]MDG4833975.1 GNAT family N-acetyltransferase [Solwaraspora sp. WMMD1047]